MAAGKYKSSELYGRPTDPEPMKQRRQYMCNKTGRDEREPQLRPANKPRSSLLLKGVRMPLSVDSPGWACG